MRNRMIRPLPPHSLDCSAHAHSRWIRMPDAQDLPRHTLHCCWPIRVVLLPQCCPRPLLDTRSIRCPQDHASQLGKVNRYLVKDFVHPCTKSKLGQRDGYLTVAVLVTYATRPSASSHKLSSDSTVLKDFFADATPASDLRSYATAL